MTCSLNDTKIIFRKALRVWGCKMVWLLGILLINNSTRGVCQTKPMYSQYMFNMLTINPAYAGNRNTLNANLIFRRQWVGVPGAPATGVLSIDRKQDESNWGMGGLFYFDKIGIEKSTGFQASTSYHIPLAYRSSSYSGLESPITLSIGLGFGVKNYSADFTRLQTIQPNDPLFMNVINKFGPTSGFGFLLSSDNWYFGLSAPALIKLNLFKNTRSSDISSLLTNNEIFFNAGYILGKENDNIRWKPSILAKMAPGTSVQYDINLSVWYSSLLAGGVSFRTGDALVFLAEVQLNPNLRLGYSYDYTTSLLNSYSRGSHEMMLRYEIGSSGRGIACPIRFY